VNKTHVYKGREISRSTNCANVNAGRRWQIASYHHATGLRYSEEDGQGYYSLQAAKDAIDMDHEDEA